MKRISEVVFYLKKYTIYTKYLVQPVGRSNDI